MKKLLGILSATAFFGGMIQSTNASLPPISEVTWELCNVEGIIVDRQINKCPTITEYFWGEIKEVKFFKKESGRHNSNDKVFTYLKNQGCVGSYAEPQKEDWYPIRFRGMRETEPGSGTFKIISKRIISSEQEKKTIYSDARKPSFLLRTTNICEPMPPHFRSEVGE